MAAAAVLNISWTMLVNILSPNRFLMTCDIQIHAVVHAELKLATIAGCMAFIVLFAIERAVKMQCEAANILK